ncbi:MAG: hypothetical protein LIO70_08725, partial [Clostridiales bacterium]|nr:hypothetical protein [Clostridiales bacterium]
MRFKPGQRPFCDNVINLRIYFAFLKKNVSALKIRLARPMEKQNVTQPPSAAVSPVRSYIVSDGIDHLIEGQGEAASGIGG